MTVSETRELREPEIKRPKKKSFWRKFHEARMIRICKMVMPYEFATVKVALMFMFVNFFPRTLRSIDAEVISPYMVTGYVTALRYNHLRRARLFARLYARQNRTIYSDVQRRAFMRHVFLNAVLIPRNIRTQEIGRLANLGYTVSPDKLKIIADGAVAGSKDGTSGDVERLMREAEVRLGIAPPQRYAQSLLTKRDVRMRESGRDPKAEAIARREQRLRSRKK